jgi:hypothetical protein
VHGAGADAAAWRIVDCRPATVTIADRVEALVLAAIARPIVVLPLPLVGGETLTHPASLEADHAHVDPICSCSVCVLASATTSRSDGVSVAVQSGTGEGAGPGGAGAGGGGEAVSASCDTANCWSAIAITPRRAVSPFTSTVKSTPPEPVRESVGTWIHPSFEVACHVQPLIVVTVMWPLPPLPGIIALGGDSVYVHGRASSEMEILWLLTSMAALRAVTSGLASTVAVRVVSPWPDPLLSRIQVASLFAVQVQSRVVLMPIDTEPPPAVTFDGFALSDIWHRGSSGADVCVMLVDPHATAKAATTASSTMTHARAYR